MQAFAFIDLMNNFTKIHSGDCQINQGSSLIIMHNDGLYFSMVKPKFWRSEDNKVAIDFSGIGGAIEENETPMECLKRELLEEIQLDIGDLAFAYPEKTLIIDDSDKIQEIRVKGETNVPCPIYILEFKLPMRRDKKIEGKIYSCLQLFVYLARLKSNCLPEISENEDIPALIHVNKAILGELLKGKLSIINKEAPNGLKIYWNKKFDVEIPDNIALTPKFTPTGLIKARLNFNSLLGILDRGKVG